jgi:glycosyltransferase involved in cell wall biosynthesis
LKLVIQIPAFNEAATLGIALGDLPRSLPGVDQVEWLVVDDGSTDATSEVARQRGVDHIVRLPTNRGLARAFTTGVEAALRAGADIIVNTDADNQYRAADIPALIAPILAGKADMVIGERPIDQMAHFSRTKKLLQRLGSRVVQLASNTRVPDAPSGFRAFSRQAALQINVFNNYTYTLETIIQAGQKGLTVVSVPVRVNPDLRPSRLVRSIPQYLQRSALTIGRIFVTYRPLRFFLAVSGLLFVPGCLIGVRFLFEFGRGRGQGHVQSLILAAILMIGSMLFFMLGLLADLISVNRRLLEDLRTRLAGLELRTDASDLVSREERNPEPGTPGDSAADHQHRPTAS